MIFIPGTEVKESTSIDLDKISKINQFSREFSNTDLSMDAGFEILKEIAKRKPYNIWVRILGACLVSSFFCLIFGGAPIDFVSAFIIGAFSYIASILLDKVETNPFIRGFLCCAMSTFLAIIATNIGLGANVSSIIIGSIMIFLPGVAITNAVRDTLSGHMLAGVTKGIEAVIIAISLAVGVGFAFEVWQTLGGIIQ